MRFSTFFILFLFLDVVGAVDVAFEFMIGTEDECRGSQKILREPEGLLITPQSGRYRDNCEWTITLDSTDPTSSLQLKFESFNLGSGDWVHVSDALFNNSVVDVTYSQNNPPNGSTFTVNRYVQIKFKSNGDNNVGLGFKLYWNRLVPEITTLPGLPAGTIYRDVYANRDDDFIQTPNHPGKYPVGIKIYWLLRSTSSDSRVELQFSAFHLSIDDTLSIYDGNLDLRENRRKQYTGYSDSVPGNIVSNGNSVLVVFDSSPVVPETGFKIFYRIFIETETQTTEKSENTPKPLTQAETAGIIVSIVIVTLIVVIVVVYFKIYRPKMKREMRKIATEMYEADVRQSHLSPEDIPRPKRRTDEEDLATLAAAATSHSIHSSLWVSANVGQTTGSRRPGSAAGMVNRGATFGSAAAEIRSAPSTSGRLPPIQDVEDGGKKKKKKKRKFKLLAKLPVLRGLMSHPDMIKQDVLKGAEVPGAVEYSVQILKPARPNTAIRPKTALETQEVYDEEVVVN